MEMYRLTLKSTTAFFRNEFTSTSYQESYNCPPLSTIHGIIAAAFGEYRYDISVGYIFNSSFKSMDYELILRKNSTHKDLYQVYRSDNRFDRNDILRGCSGTLPVKRELMFDCILTLYLNDEEIANSFNQPFYSLLLGRSEDLAKVIAPPKKVVLESLNGRVNFGKTIVPFQEAKTIPGRITKMNVELTDSDPRTVKRSGIFSIIDREWSLTNLPSSVKYDTELGIGVYIHKGKKDV